MFILSFIIKQSFGNLGYSIYRKRSDVLVC